MLGPFVSHGELYPEYRLVQRAHWPVVVDTGQPHGVLLVPVNVQGSKMQINALCTYQSLLLIKSWDK